MKGHATLNSKTIDSLFEDTSVEIWAQRAMGFNFIFDNPDAPLQAVSANVFKKGLADTAENKLEPISSTRIDPIKKIFVAINKPPYQNNEPYIQALRYLRGFLLI